MGTPGTSPLCWKMGDKLTVLENRTWFNIEFKMWVDGSRPDRFKKIVRIEPGKSIRVKASTFNSDDQGSLEHAILLVYANGSWTGKYILPQDLFAWAAVFCDSNRHGQVILRARRANFNLFRLKCFAFLPAKYGGLGMAEEEI
ncbi:uncharacterized protein LOC113779283 isoform X1 [Coffea eugenioides]|uniref:uncharacterized protein LOC113779283 isoform X1 n=1 Tax=Coffea eugenioides TaxID=49369 RepID=UPI000F614FA4|nr:uncharacterized protein LOC113779283 isoform X1 [Coffea eugenioides]